MLTSIDHVWGICVTNRRSTFSQWGPGGGVLNHPSNEHQYFPPPPHHSRALNERLPSQPPAHLYVCPSRQQLPPWAQLQLCNNMFWHFFRGWGVIIGDSLAISRQSNCRQLSHFAICWQSKCRQSINRLSTFLPPQVAAQNITRALLRKGGSLLHSTNDTICLKKYTQPLAEYTTENCVSQKTLLLCILFGLIRDAVC